MDLCFEFKQIVFMKLPSSKSSTLQQAYPEAFATNLCLEYNRICSQETSADRAHDAANRKGLWSFAYQWEETSNKDYCLSLEFISPKFDLCMGSDWRKKVTNHWIKVEMLLAGRGDSCIAHILYSPKAKTGWSLEQLKRVAQALSYFETAFLANLAPSIHMRNKFNSEEPSDSLLEQRRERIEACAKMDDLVIEMQSQKEKRFLYGWRSENANKDGTIELRTARGAVLGEMIAVWVSIGHSFLQAAAQHGTKEYLNKEKYSPNLEGLHRFTLLE